MHVSTFAYFMLAYPLGCVVSNPHQREAAQFVTLCKGKRQFRHIYPSWWWKSGVICRRESPTCCFDWDFLVKGADLR